MKDIANPKVMWLKAILFLILGLLSSAMLLLEAPSWKAAVLIVAAVWAFCRAYCFAFYVLEHYADPNCRVFRIALSCQIYPPQEIGRPSQGPVATVTLIRT